MCLYQTPGWRPPPITGCFVNTVTRGWVGAPNGLAPFRFVFFGVFEKFDTFFFKICAHSERYRNLLVGIFEILTFDGNIAFPLSPVERNKSKDPNDDEVFTFPRGERSFRRSSHVELGVGCTAVLQQKQHVKKPTHRSTHPTTRHVEQRSRAYSSSR